MEEFTENREKLIEKRQEKLRKRRHSSSSSNSRSRSHSRGHRSRKKSSHRHLTKRSRRSRTKRRSSSYSRSPSCHRRTRYYGSRENPFKSRVVGVFGLSSMTNEVKLMEVFGQFGAIEHVSIIHDAKTGNSRGFGFIYYNKMEHATKARTECNGSTMDGKKIRVDYSITKRAHTPTPGIYMGSRSPRERHRSNSRRRSSHHRRNYSNSRSRSRSRSRKPYR